MGLARVRGAVVIQSYIYLVDHPSFSIVGILRVSLNLNNILPVTLRYFNGMAPRILLHEVSLGLGAKHMVHPQCYHLHFAMYCTKRDPMT